MRALVRAVVALAVAWVVAIPAAAAAAWGAAGTGVGRAHAASMPAGPTPTVSVVGRNVTVGWVARSFGDGTPVEGYALERYDGGGVAHGAGAACDGTIAALTCVEGAVPPGTWRYTVRAVHGGWTGAEGPTSVAVTVDPPTLAWDVPATLATLPAVLTGDVAGFVDGEAVTFRLDDPDTGQPLGGSTAPDPVPFGGTAAVSVTIPGSVPDGAHDVYAVGDAGSIASAQVVVDRTAPVVDGAAIAKSSGGAGGAIRPGGTYSVYANAGDAASSVASVTADVSAITAGATTVPLVAGSWTLDGVAYGFRSAPQTADGSIPEGPTGFAVTATDAAGNASVPAPFSVTVDDTAPGGADVQATNGGATAGKAESGDTVTFTFTEPIDPGSLIPSWDGSPAAVTVRIVNQGGSDRLEVWDAANGAQLDAFGTVRLGRADYVAATVSFTGSTAIVAGDTVTIGLGTPSGATGTAANRGRMRWTTSASATDLAGNACAAGNVNEPGANDVDF